MDFEQAYRELLEHQTGLGHKRPEEMADKDRQHAERMFLQRVWWPGFQSFANLYPEYAVRDYKDGKRYIDFAYIHEPWRIAIEIDGISSHLRDISQEQFADHLRRQNHLIIDRWNLLRFAYQDVKEHPRACLQTIQQLVGRLTAEPTPELQDEKAVDREILRFAYGVGRPIAVRDVMTLCNLGAHAAAAHLKRLVEEGWLEVASGTTRRVCSYRMHPSRANVRL